MADQIPWHGPCPICGLPTVIGNVHVCCDPFEGEYKPEFRVTEELGDSYDWHVRNAHLPVDSAIASAFQRADDDGDWQPCARLNALFMVGAIILSEVGAFAAGYLFAKYMGG